MSTHTAGPWRVYTARDGSRNVSGGARGLEAICQFSHKNGGGRDVAEADGRLIAAAPNLLDACNGLLGLLQLIAGRDDISPAVKHALTNSHRITDAQSAIAKASAP